jgi:hypothetical protein
MTLVRALILVTFGTLPGIAAAQQVTEIYKCVDGGGRPLYTSDKRDTAGKKCELVSREINVVPAQKFKPAPAPARDARNFPKETPAERVSAKGRQRDILEKELFSEQEALSKAQQGLQPYRDNVQTHEKNIEALRRELSNLR